jgi:hypothetical protein
MTNGSTGEKIKEKVTGTKDKVKETVTGTKDKVKETVTGTKESEWEEEAKEPRGRRGNWDLERLRQLKKRLQRQAQIARQER